MTDSEIVHAPPAQARQITFAGNGSAGAVVFQGCPELTAALAAARDYCGEAPHDRRVKFGTTNYSYSSAESVLTTANGALAESGLALIPLEATLRVEGSGQMAFYALYRTLVLSHQSGEFVPLHVNAWPVIPDKGRALDKVFAAALTESLSYVLRDLLQMRRGEVPGMNERNDEEPEEAPAPAPGAADGEPPPGPPGPHANPEQVRRILKLMAARKLNATRVRERLQDRYGVDSLFLLSPEQADEVENLLQTPPEST